MTDEFPTWKSIPILSIACPLIYLIEIIIRRSIYVNLYTVLGAYSASLSSSLTALGNTGYLVSTTAVASTLFTFSLVITGNVISVNDVLSYSKWSVNGVW